MHNIVEYSLQNYYIVQRSNPIGAKNMDFSLVSKALMQINMSDHYLATAITKFWHCQSAFWLLSICSKVDYYMAAKSCQLHAVAMYYNEVQKIYHAVARL